MEWLDVGELNKYLTWPWSLQVGRRYVFLAIITRNAFTVPCTQAPELLMYASCANRRQKKRSTSLDDVRGAEKLPPPEVYHIYLLKEGSPFQRHLRTAWMTRLIVSHTSAFFFMLCEQNRATIEQYLMSEMSWQEKKTWEALINVLEVDIGNI